jgi:polysaccharide export outer membrane protein
LIVSKNIKYFTALGATGKSAQVPFMTQQVSLIEALGQVGGLIDERADADGVFVFRYESREIAKQLCNQCRLPDNIPQVPVVFHLNMSQARSLFSAQEFQLDHRDLLYIANAPLIQVDKALSVIRDFMSPILTGAVLDRAVTAK